MLRWSIGRLVDEHYRGGFPLATFLINVSGAVVIGFLSVLFGVDWPDRCGTQLNAGILTGVLGGYTTFSSMQLDAAKLADKSRRGAALFYVLISVVAGLVAGGLGGVVAQLGARHPHV